MAWVCERCGTIHTQNPKTCRECGHSIFESMGREELRRRSEGEEIPESLNWENIETVGTAKEPEYESSPDVAIDGSIMQQSDDSVSSNTTSGRSIPFRSLYHKLRGMVLAPFQLLREYIVPILAFIIAFGGLIWLLSSL